jgi:hypothetical protein
MFRGVFLSTAFMVSIVSTLVFVDSAHSYTNLNQLLKNPVFNLEGFISDLNQTDSPKSLESTLKELKKVEPHFFDHYILMYKSRSLQTSSFMYPRVLLNSPDSTTVISYNGDPTDHGFDKLEVMRFDPQTTKFTFNEISFLNGSLKLSKNNPQKCMNCHQNSSRVENDPRPNWEPYSIWPGAYSSLSVSGRELSDPKSPKFDLVVDADSKSENEMYQKFLDEVAPDHPRYNLLKPMETSSRGLYFPAIGVPKDAPNKFTTTFTDKLMNLNALRIARLINKTKIMSDYKKVVYALAKCEHIYLPKEIFDWHRSIIRPDMDRTPNLEQFDDAIDLIFEPYGISTQDWSMDFGTGGKFSFRHRFGGPASFRTSFYSALKMKMPELKLKTCGELETEIMAHDFTATKTFRNQMDLDLSDGLKAGPSLLSRCVSCHTSSSFGAPYIPFNNEMELGDALKDTGYPRGSLKDEIFYRIGVHAQFFERMPKDGYLPTPAEVEGLKAYLDGF